MRVCGVCPRRQKILGTALDPKALVQIVTSLVATRAMKAVYEGLHGINWWLRIGQQLRNDSFSN